eukprot:NODE_4235_length_825_cov_5.899485_g3502_i0.p3 GENE.NODE_4235_length_825_cov_5.899485_g3502_i0~~NODE_4235_length_825_cov_5.899485_g3502_i0.p3  ORF type:complete len:76 (+),score=3.44 NODE_4235_length_825_cov_5.899485_g3502_i0:367-594(+)
MGGTADRIQPLVAATVWGRCRGRCRVMAAMWGRCRVIAAALWGHCGRSVGPLPGARGPPGCGGQPSGHSPRADCP